MCSVSVFFVRVGSQIYLHVERKKIQISPPLGEQDQSNALPQGQQRQSNPHPMPCLPPPRRHDIDRCIRGWLMDGYLSHASLNLPSEEWKEGYSFLNTVPCVCYLLLEGEFPPIRVSRWLQHNEKKFERYNESFLNANFMKTQKYKSRMTTAIYLRSRMLHVGKE